MACATRAGCSGSSLVGLQLGFHTGGLPVVECLFLLTLEKTAETESRCGTRLYDPLEILLSFLPKGTLPVGYKTERRHQGCLQASC